MSELSLSEMITKAIELKDGDKEFALFYMDYNKTFFAEIGNPASHAVMLGKASVVLRVSPTLYIFNK
jgi:hypothetical protein